jgi:recombination associated protein RdgC
MRIAMTWNDRISFVLTEQMQIKRIEFLDIIKNESTEMAENANALGGEAGIS